MKFKINNSEYAAFFQPYITAISNNDMGLQGNLEYSHKKAMELLSSIPLEKQMHQYEKGKWTIKEIIQHIIDTERVFNYRALRFARRDHIELPGFDENHFVAYSKAGERDYNLLLDEFTTLRKSTCYLYESFSDEALLEVGMINDNNMSVRALGYLTSGHLIHHLDVIKKRYL